MRIAAAVLAVSGLAGLLTAVLYLLQSGPARGPATPPTPSDRNTVEPATDRASAVLEPHDEPGHPLELATDRPGRDGVEPGAAGADNPLPRAETALLFRVVDARDGKPLETFEVRLGQRFLRPLLDEEGRIRHDFPDGRARFPGLIESREGKSVNLAILARGFAELRVPDLYVAPGREFDLGTLRLERVPRVVVRVLDDATGEPVPGARVSLLAAGRAPEPETRPPASAALDPWSARTDKNGCVLLTSRPGERATLSVRHATHAALDAELVLPLSEERRETVRLEARLPE